ncbi:MAG TPA: GGDEF domain-containing protein [Myxococcales bacterium]|nr:GGDEF domain-containing protein [Myxococcales bacterium]
MAALLPSAAFTLVPVADWERGRRELSEWIPAAILLAAEDGGDPFAAVKWVRSRERLAFAPVVLFAPADGQLSVGEGMAAGADEVVAHSRSASEVVECIVARIARARTLELLAMRDPLTELHNRRFMNDRLPAEVARAARTRSVLALAIIDLDEFKPINDSRGHAIGDRVLRAFGRTLSTGLRSYDQVCRYGGDEFVALFPDCVAAGAKSALSKFRSRGGWALDDLPPVTFSAGIAEFPRDGRLLEELFEAADRNLRLAKQSGRDGIVGA